ncbi:MAG: bifunctional diaminohydroxyphosphoribosylaminopyrimidine deaminase/5-amino-6-(5-phosphoribosylamino)uracil reductase RibD [Chitinophagaceae bacterium]|nr:bifunctional diaminohydroxyphosphoribosylaminopyrimidine deaminase/5-amino-6-(5-phosphoribosylamino)uracil reductase RibD [Chitinophagaceae bacterium]
MQRCLQLAALAKGHTAPNPMVGAVLVHEGRIIGEGYHRQYGQAHAEVNCFESVAETDRHLVPASVLYVSLEPCAHFGKTPPCAHRIVKEGVKKVVICNRDPFAQVDGKGISILQDNGIEVITGVLEQEGAWLNRRFFTFHKEHRPYIILKWAQTDNGFFAPADRSRFQMSNAYSQRLSHQWRREEAAILVGTRTALNDNPQLLSRYGAGRQPLRIALDKELQLPATHQLLSGTHPTWIINRLRDGTEGHTRYVHYDGGAGVMDFLLALLYRENIQSLIVEGGAVLLQSCIDAGLWDEARVLITPPVLEQGIAAPAVSNATLLLDTALDQDRLRVFGRDAHSYTPLTGTALSL